MITKEEAKENIKKLVKEFSEYSKEELDRKSENQIKSEFIDPLFEALGWDMRKDAERESRILKGRADYILKIGNQENLVIEAKKADIRLSEDEGRQAVSYAYHRKIKFSVLTNFKFLRVYHALSNIKDVDRNLLFWLEFKDFEREFDKLWLISKESFEKKEINKLLSKKDEKQFIPVDESILADLLEIRKLLSNDLKKLRMYLTDEKIDEAIQILIDRLIFMRSVEDRGLENQNFLLGLVKDSREGRLKTKLWYALEEQFKALDKSYNSKLFASNILEDEKNIFFDDDTLEKIIRILYFGVKEQQSRYMFDLIPGDLLGSIYEQYLGVVLRGTEQRVKLDSKSGKRKKMGIYYTPSYIVDYIVKNTVGEYIKNKTIDEILEVRIVDPACGSGSFIVKAFQEVCDIIEQKLKSGEKAKNSTFKNYDGRLNLAQKITILSRCIYGVDLDEKAIELAQLNLLLKILEGETRETRKLLLPNLKDNIKNGNSLIDDSKIAGDKAFNWHAQFPDVFRNGGFDVVVGNPPYILLQNKYRDDTLLQFIKEKYETASYKIDTYHLFIEKGISLLKNEGCLGFIIPSNFMTNNYLVGLRQFIVKETEISEIDSLGGKIFGDASVDTAILILRKTKKIAKDKIATFTSSFINNSSLVNSNKVIFSQNELMKSKEILFKQGGNLDLLSKVEKDSIELKEIANVNFGMQLRDRTKYLDDVIQLKNDTDKKRITSKHKPCLTGKNVQRYYTSFSDLYCFEDLSAKKGGCWNLNLHHMKNKILVRQIGKIPICSLDQEGMNCLNTLFMISLKNKKDNPRFILGLLNSKMMGYLWKKKFYDERETFPKIKGSYLEHLPIRLPSPSQEQKIISLVDEMLELQKKNHGENISGHEKERIEQQIKNMDYEIDAEVYKLYGITKEEQKIIEESLK